MLMNKIYTLMNKSNVDWKSDVLYPITLFSVACLILLLSSFSTKASFETATTELTESATSIIDEAEFASCCTRSVSNTTQCNTGTNYVFFLRSNKKDASGSDIRESYYIASSSTTSWEECDDGTC